jgi:hypothetical protein
VDTIDESSKLLLRPAAHSLNRPVSELTALDVERRAAPSPLAPARAALRAGRLVLKEIERLIQARESFSFESTLSGRGYVATLKRLKVSD